MKEWKSFSIGFYYNDDKGDENLTKLLNDVEKSGWHIFSINTTSSPSFEDGGAIYISAWKEKEINSENKEET